MKARPGSLHGYDIIDHSVLNPEIGSMEAMQKYVDRLKQFRMGLVLDIVPNHMCVADVANLQWFDVFGKWAQLSLRGILRRRLEPSPAGPREQGTLTDPWRPVWSRARESANPRRVHVGFLRCAILRQDVPACAKELAYDSRTGATAGSAASRRFEPERA